VRIICTLKIAFLPIVLISLVIPFNNSRARHAEELKKLLPGSKDIAPWQSSNEVDIYKNKQLYDYINGGAEIFYEYGFEAVLVQEYKSGEKSLVVELYNMADTDAAFGIYSIHRDAKQPKHDIGDDATLFDYHIAFWQDKYYIVIMGYEKSDRAKEALILFAKHIANKIVNHNTGPAFINRLPQENKLGRSERWLEGVLGVNGVYHFGKGNIWFAGRENVEIVAADYQKSENASCTLLLAEYGNAADAQTVFMNIVIILDEKIEPEHATESGFRQWIDSYKRLVLAGCRDTRVAVAVRATDEDFTKKIVQNALESP
jgi:hypothetical protein